jgi:hypothetical protein
MDKMNKETLAERIIETAIELTENELYSKYGEYYYHIQRDSADEDWYIQVWPHEYEYVYDGWWKDSKDRSIKDAVKEAIEGGMILDDLLIDVQSKRMN